MSLGPLVPADESFTHQITDTFGTVGGSDRSWTEKVCAMAAARDGSVQLHFGMGKYPNRGVLDAYAGVSQGVEQWTVRASRALASAPGETTVGPITYAVEEPLQRVRFALAENDVLPLSFEWTFSGVVPPMLERREVHRSADGYRQDADIVRYHQIGVAVSGWVEVDGERTEVEEATWFSTRDHSWGVRYMVGAPVEDVAPRPDVPGLASLVLWSPMLLEREDGSRYGMHVYHQRHAVAGYERVELQGGAEHPDGTKEPFSSMVPELGFRDDNRRLQGGTLRCATADGTERPITLTTLGDTGFHLGTGLYFGFEGHWHGEWRGPLHVDGEHVVDCTDVATAHHIHQFRDAVVKVEDPVGGGSGWGNAQTLVTGPHPDLGLTETASFL